MSRKTTMQKGQFNAISKSFLSFFLSEYRSGRLHEVRTSWATIQKLYVPEMCSIIKQIHLQEKTMIWGPRQAFQDKDTSPGFAAEGCLGHPNLVAPLIPVTLPPTKLAQHWSSRLLRPGPSPGHSERFSSQPVLLASSSSDIPAEEPGMFHGSHYPSLPSSSWFYSQRNCQLGETEHKAGNVKVRVTRHCSVSPTGNRADTV